jgi:hypothetical protein
MVQVALGPSRRLGTLLTAAHLAALVAAATALPGLALAPAVLALVLNWLFNWQRHVVRSVPEAVTGLQVKGREATLRRRDGRADSGRIRSAFVSPMLVILIVRCPGRLLACSVVITPDATGAHAHRRLRVGLKWGQLPADSPHHV